MVNGTLPNGLSNGGPPGATPMTNGNHGTPFTNGQTNGISGAVANGASGSQPLSMQAMPGGQRMVRDICPSASGFSVYQYLHLPRLKAHQGSSPTRSRDCQVGSNP